MKFNVYSIHDKRVEEWSMPYMEPTDQHALRAFRMAYMNADQNNSLRKFPQDYDLYMVATWDTEEGLIAPCTQKLLVNAETFKHQDEATKRAREIEDGSK